MILHFKKYQRLNVWYTVNSLYNKNQIVNSIQEFIENGWNNVEGIKHTLHVWFNTFNSFNHFSIIYLIKLKTWFLLYREFTVYCSVYVVCIYFCFQYVLSEALSGQWFRQNPRWGPFRRVLGARTKECPSIWLLQAER